MEDAIAADNKYGVRVLHDIEIGESWWNKEFANKMLKLCDYDVIIGSVHSIDCENWNMPYSRIDFSGWKEDELYRFMSIYFDNVSKMLDFIINRGIALEINTSETDRALNATMPCEWIIDMYVRLGGRIVIIGSDAHIASDIGKGIDKAIEILKKAGLKSYFYFENRKPIECFCKTDFAMNV